LLSGTKECEKGEQKNKDTQKRRFFPASIKGKGKEKNRKPDHSTTREEPKNW